MAPLFVLVAATLLARLVGQFGARPLRDWTGATRVGLAVMFCFTAAAHAAYQRAIGLELDEAVRRFLQKRSAALRGKA